MRTLRYRFVPEKLEITKHPASCPDCFSRSTQSVFQDRPRPLPRLFQRLRDCFNLAQTVLNSPRLFQSRSVLRRLFQFGPDCFSLSRTVSIWADCSSFVQTVLISPRLFQSCSVSPRLFQFRPNCFSVFQTVSVSPRLFGSRPDYFTLVQSRTDFFLQFNEGHAQTVS